MRRGWIIGLSGIAALAALLLVQDWATITAPRRDKLRRTAPPQLVAIDSPVALASHNESVEEHPEKPERRPAIKRLPPVEELAALSDLPPVCMSDLPGLERTNAQGQISNLKPQISDSKSEIQNLKSEILNQQSAISNQQSSLPNPHPKSSLAWQQVRQELPAGEASGLDPHAEAFAKDCFPSATACRKCHEQIYEEWAISSHANAAVSPMFHKFEQKISALSQGTIGYFCMRCHAPVATTMKHPRWAPISQGPKVFREGVTCVACHRVVEKYAKTNGERRMEPGPLESPIVGSSDGRGMADALRRAEELKIKTDPSDPRPGQLIHNRVIQFEELSSSTFCVSCHQVAVQPQIKLEVVWEQYRHSPAYKQGVRCQDCHMGRVPGRAEGFCTTYAAVIDGKPAGPPRRHSNHAFFGPNPSITHPGVFPMNPAADRWSMEQWLAFDWRAGWGTEKFETALENGELQASFPPDWQDTDDRRDARDVLDQNFKRLGLKQAIRELTMENASHVDGPFFAYGAKRDDGSVPAGRDLKLHYVVTNRNNGHNLPTGSLGAQPQLWLNAVLVAPDGRKVWESGYLDSQGDLADLHSVDMHKGVVPFDRDLFNLQTKFLITNLKGTDREFPLPINIDVDQIPFIRPPPQPVSAINHPPLIRMENHSIAPGGSREAKYHIPGAALCQKGVYRLSVRLRSRGEPVYFMKFVDSTPEMINRMSEMILDVHAYTVAIEVK
jgi:nitrate/TMAO reductase-like tetraheme cytochrome c subunit